MHELWKASRFFFKCLVLQSDTIFLIHVHFCTFLFYLKNIYIFNCQYKATADNMEFCVVIYFKTCYSIYISSDIKDNDITMC